MVRRPHRDRRVAVAGRTSAGLLLYRRTTTGIEVLLGHMGGPFWARKDAGAWSIPKGEYDESEQPLAAALREFAEETGVPAPDGPRIDLGSVTQSGGKVVVVYATEADLDLARFVPGTFSMEWPRGSGKHQDFPEIDRIAWLDLPTARGSLVKAQQDFLDRLQTHLRHEPR